MNTMVYIASTATLDDEKKFADLYKTVPKYRQAKMQWGPISRFSDFCIMTCLLMNLISAHI